MEYDDNTRKYIVMDADIANFIDFNGWPNDVVILEVRGLEKVLDTTCLLFDPETNFSIADMCKFFDERHLDYREV